MEFDSAVNQKALKGSVDWKSPLKTKPGLLLDLRVISRKIPRSLRLLKGTAISTSEDFRRETQDVRKNQVVSTTENKEGGDWVIWS